MCIIAIKPKNKKMIDEKTLKTMFANNPDGAGYMYYDDKIKKVVVKKGFMTFNSLKKSLNEKDLTNTNVVIHFRIGTSGLKDKFNCHPYPIDENNGLNVTCDIAMAHNGILRNYEPYYKTNKNDTQMFIEYAIRPLEDDFIDNKSIRYLLSELIGTSNKLAFLDKNNKVTMINDFIEDNGYYYSNVTYKSIRNKTQNYGYKSNIDKVNAIESQWDWWKY